MLSLQRRSSLLLGPALLGLTLLCFAPMPAQAQYYPEHPYNDRYYQNRRYYDHVGRDYHVWNNGEDRAYRYYLNDQHLPYRDWRYVKGPDQRAYFAWRHTHPDAVIVVH